MRLDLSVASNSYCRVQKIFRISNECHWMYATIAFKSENFCYRFSYRLYIIIHFLTTISNKDRVGCWFCRFFVNFWFLLVWWQPKQICDGGCDCLFIFVFYFTFLYFISIQFPTYHIHGINTLIICMMTTDCLPAWVYYSVWNHFNFLNGSSCFLFEFLIKTNYQMFIFSFGRKQNTELPMTQTF